MPLVGLTQVGCERFNVPKTDGAAYIVPVTAVYTTVAEEDEEDEGEGYLGITDVEEKAWVTKETHCRGDLNLQKLMERVDMTSSKVVVMVALRVTRVMGNNEVEKIN